MRYRRAHRGRAAFLGLVLALVLLSTWAHRTMAPVLIAYAGKQMEILGIDAVTRAVRQRIADQVAYDDLVHIERDADGRVTVMQVNTVALSGILAGVEESVLAALRDVQAASFEIPLGVLLGSQVFAAYGPRVTARALAVGAPEVFFDQSFEAAGINQTRHTVNLVVTARLRVLVPLVSEDTEITTRLPLVETVIIGPVPDHYLNLDWLWPQPPTGR